MVFFVEHSRSSDITRWWDLTEAASEEILVGRNPDRCAIVLNDLNISRCHASLEVRSAPSSCLITDLNTRNGTFCDGIPLKQSKLLPFESKSIICFADAPFTYTFQLEIPNCPDKYLALHMPAYPSSSQERSTVATSGTVSSLSCSAKHDSSIFPAEKNNDVPPVIEMTSVASSSTVLSSFTESSANTPVEKTFSKKKRRFESKWDIEIPPTIPSNNSSFPMAAEKIAERLRDEAAERAKQLNEANRRQIKEKRKLLWSRKEEPTAQSSVAPAAMTVSQEKSSLAPASDSVNLTSHGYAERSNLLLAGDPNQYSRSFDCNSDKKSKFLKLMGHKSSCSDIEKSSEALLEPPINRTIDQISKPSDAQREIELEQQYYQGLKRKDGRKTGLGL